jgi:hypothetical protein
MEDWYSMTKLMQMRKKELLNSSRNIRLAARAAKFNFISRSGYFRRVQLNKNKAEGTQDNPFIRKEIKHIRLKQLKHLYR